MQLRPRQKNTSNITHAEAIVEAEKIILDLNSDPINRIKASFARAINFYFYNKSDKKCDLSLCNQYFEEIIRLIHNYSLNPEINQQRLKKFRGVAFLHLGMLNIYEGSYMEGKNYLTKAKKELNEDPLSQESVTLTVAKTYFSRRHYQDALDTVNESNSNSLKLSLMKGIILCQMQREDEALKLLQGTINEKFKDLEELKSEINSDFSDDRNRFVNNAVIFLSLILFKEKKFKDVIKYLSIITTIDDSFLPSLDYKHLFLKASFALASSYYSVGSVEECIKTANAGLQFYSNVSNSKYNCFAYDLNYLLGVVYHNKKEFNKRNEYLQNALNSDIKDEDSYVFINKILADDSYKKNKHNEALQFYKNIISFYENKNNLNHQEYCNALAYAGVCFDYENNPTECIEYLNKAYKIYLSIFVPSIDLIKIMLQALAKLGAVYLKNKKFDEAEVILKQADLLIPKAHSKSEQDAKDKWKVTISQQLGFVYFKQKKYKDAVKLLDNCFQSLKQSQNLKLFNPNLSDDISTVEFISIAIGLSIAYFQTDQIDKSNEYGNFSLKLIAKDPNSLKDYMPVLENWLENEKFENRLAQGVPQLIHLRNSIKLERDSAKRKSHQMENEDDQQLPKLKQIKIEKSPSENDANEFSADIIGLELKEIFLKKHAFEEWQEEIIKKLTDFNFESFRKFFEAMQAIDKANREKEINERLIEIFYLTVREQNPNAALLQSEDLMKYLKKGDYYVKISRFIPAIRNPDACWLKLLNLSEIKSLYLTSLLVEMKDSDLELMIKTWRLEKPNHDFDPRMKWVRNFKMLLNSVPDLVIDQNAIKLRKELSELKREIIKLRGEKIDLLNELNQFKTELIQRGPSFIAKKANLIKRFKNPNESEEIHAINDIRFFDVFDAYHKELKLVDANGFINSLVRLNRFIDLLNFHFVENDNHEPLLLSKKEIIEKFLKTSWTEKVDFILFYPNGIFLELLTSKEISSINISIFKHMIERLTDQECREIVGILKKSGNRFKPIKQKYKDELFKMNYCVSREKMEARIAEYEREIKSLKKENLVYEGEIIDLGNDKPEIKKLKKAVIACKNKVIDLEKGNPEIKKLKKAILAYKNEIIDLEDDNPEIKNLKKMIVVCKNIIIDLAKDNPEIKNLKKMIAACKNIIIGLEKEDLEINNLEEVIDGCKNIIINLEKGNPEIKSFKKEIVEFQIKIINLQKKLTSKKDNLSTTELMQMNFIASPVFRNAQEKQVIVVPSLSSKNENDQVENMETDEYDYLKILDSQYR